MKSEATNVSSIYLNGIISPIKKKSLPEIAKEALRDRLEFKTVYYGEKKGFGN